ncbi:MAG: alpha/beta hydrolase [Parvibaculum sp.]|uniref:alpha/beta fold hydrolase n=1 Tax=Parvibaculum sp. TaxID=2024848 RepID=UPI002716D2C9|nr:alpha/beta hydrolase [Parvibaculum sp.]MDO8839343.1 alpha/beta hydrolase [Parvibaculum sp.]MDP2125621.1 alpha/beta hydrolase [Parvibaculum sp.]
MTEFPMAPGDEEGPAVTLAPGWFTRAVAVVPESRFVEVAGTQVHYLRWGDPAKPGLLLVHGNGAHARWWSFVAPFLAREYSVAAIDVSGMGDSGWRERYTIETFAEEQIAVCEDAGFFAGEEPPIIVGHSFGGFITILTGALYGDRLAGTVIVDSPVNPPDRPGGPPDRAFRPHRIYPTLEEAMGRFRLAPPQPCENRYIVDYIARHSLKPVANPEGGDGWTWKFDPAIWQRFNIGDMGARLAATRCRIAIMRGEFSALLPAEIGEYMFNLLGRAAPVIEIPQARHHVMLDQPLAFVAALRALLADWDHSAPSRKAAGPVPSPFGE